MSVCSTAGSLVLQEQVTPLSFFLIGPQATKVYQLPHQHPKSGETQASLLCSHSESWDTRHPLFSSLPRMKPPGAPGPDRRATPVSAGSLVPNHASSTNTPSQGRGTSHSDSPQKAGTSGEPSTPLSPLPPVMGKQLGLSFASRGRGGCRWSETALLTCFSGAVPSFALTWGTATREALLNWLLKFHKSVLAHILLLSQCLLGKESFCSSISLTSPLVCCLPLMITSFNIVSDCKGTIMRISNGSSWEC